MVASHYIARPAIVFTGGEQMSDVNCTNCVSYPARRQLLGGACGVIALYRCPPTMVSRGCRDSYLADP
jgi:hypothetical protein